MTKAEAADLAWTVAVPIVQFIFVVAVVLLGFALLKEITRS